VQILRGLVVVVASTISLIVLTAISVYARMRIEMPEVKAIGLSLVKEWTLYSPIYWNTYHGRLPVNRNGVPTD
jgi:hypothetical protein